MKNQSTLLTKERIAFLLLLALAITALFVWIIKDFLIALLLAAIFAGLLHPFYRRVAKSFGGHKAAASGVTVLLSLVLVIIPLLFFIGVLVNEASQISASAGEWVNEQTQQSASLKQEVEKHRYLKQLLPYQDEILEKTGQLATKAGSFVAKGLAAGAKSTVRFLLMLFIMLYAMFFFLINGKGILDGILRFLPLSAEDRQRLLGTFISVGRATLKGTVIIGIVQGSLAGLSFWVAGIGSAVFWGAVMAVLSAIPGVGAPLIWVPAVIFLLLEGQVAAAVGVCLWCALVVGTIDNLLRPILIGKDTKMPDLLVLLTTLGGLVAFGPAGLVIGPIVGALFTTAWQQWKTAANPR